MFEDRLTEILDLRTDPFSKERVLKWLRTSGGNLNERLMKAAAAEFIEENVTEEV